MKSRLANGLFFLVATLSWAWLAGCGKSPASKSESRQAAAGSPSAAGSPADSFASQRSQKAARLHAVDPRTLSETEVKYGIAPKRSAEVEYQTGVVLMEQGDKAIQSTMSDGVTWNFNANSPGVGDFQVGKVVFATSRAVGRILSLKRAGDSVSAVLGPVQITDVIKNGSFSMDEPINLDNSISYSAPDFPGGSDVNWPAKTASRPTPVVGELAGIRQDHSTRIPNSNRTRQPLPVSWSMPATSAACRRTGNSRFRHRPRLVPIRLYQIPGGPGNPASGKLPGSNLAPPASIAGAPSATIDKFTGFPFLSKSAAGLRLNYGDAERAMRIDATGTLSLEGFRLAFDLDIVDGTIERAGVTLEGAIGIKLDFQAFTFKEFNANAKGQYQLPIDMSIPLTSIGGVPFTITFHESVLLNSAFSAKQSMLKANGEYTFTGKIFAGYKKPGWTFEHPLDVKSKTEIANTAQGISVGINSLVLGFRVQVMVGIGAFGFNTGVYGGVVFSGTVLKQSDTTMYQCRSGTINIDIDSGVGYSLPKAVFTFVNIFVHALTGSELPTSGTLLRGPTFSVLTRRLDIPTSCAGQKKE